MANASRKVGNKPIVKSKDNLYKKGKLSKRARFSTKKIKWTPIIVLSCVILSFIFAMIFGNALGKKAQNSQNTPPITDNPSNIIPPSADKVEPRDKLHAYFVDMSDADPEKSLSDQTAVARNKGNALFIEIKNTENKIIYSSDKTIELGFNHQDNLELSRLANHLEYYNDFTIGIFKSDFSSNLDGEKALMCQANELLLLKEACDVTFDQMIIEFSGDFTKENLIYYQTYLLNLKLACNKTPIGVKFSEAFLRDSNNSGIIAGLMSIADFFVLDVTDNSLDGISSSLAPITYFIERYDCIVMLSDEDESLLNEKIALLENKKIENYIVK